jgi:hypothetical protein
VVVNQFAQFWGAKIIAHKTAESNPVAKIQHRCFPGVAVTWVTG